MKCFIVNTISAVFWLALPAVVAAGPPAPISGANLVYAQFFTGNRGLSLPKSAQRQDPIMANCTADSLTGAPWKITTSVFAEMLPDRPAQVTFHADSLRLDAPCNFFTTKAQIGAGTLVVFPFENMPKTCGLQAMEVEGALLRAFTRAVGFSITPGGELILTAADGSALIRATR